MGWIYDPVSKRYRDTTTGRYLSKSQVMAMVNQSVEAGAFDAAELARVAKQTGMTAAEFEAIMRQQIKLAYIREYALGRGGVDQITREDWGSIGGMLGEQYRYLAPFAQQIENLTEGQIATRAAMYIRSSREAYERAAARSYGIAEDELPLYPGQGQTRCLTNCDCHWEIVEVREGRALIGFDAYWTLGATEQHCDDCLSNSSSYNPYPIRF